MEAGVSGSGEPTLERSRRGPGSASQVLGTASIKGTATTPSSGRTCCGTTPAQPARPPVDTWLWSPIRTSSTSSTRCIRTPISAVARRRRWRAAGSGSPGRPGRSRRGTAAVRTMPAQARIAWRCAPTTTTSGATSTGRTRDSSANSPAALRPIPTRARFRATHMDPPITTPSSSTPTTPIPTATVASGTARDSPPFIADSRDMQRSSVSHVSPGPHRPSCPHVVMGPGPAPPRHSPCSTHTSPDSQSPSPTHVVGTQTLPKWEATPTAPAGQPGVHECTTMSALAIHGASAITRTRMPLRIVLPPTSR